MDLNAYRAFVLAVDRGTITDAASALGISRPTLSRQLARLEESLGLALLHRTTRQVRVTPQGRQLYEQLRPVFDDVDRIEARLQQERTEAVGWVRISVPPVIAVDLYPTLHGLRERHPKLGVEVIADVRHLDLRSDEIDVAVRAGRIRDPELVQRRLGKREVYAVASPAYLERRGRPASVADLREHDLLRGHDAEGRPQSWWPSRTGDQITVDGAFVSNDQRVLLEAALAGAGIALVSDVSAGRPIADGTLERVLPDALGTVLVLHAVFARRTLQPASVRVCVDALVEWAKAGGAARLTGG